MYLTFQSGFLSNQCSNTKKNILPYYQRVYLKMVCAVQFNGLQTCFSYFLTMMTLIPKFTHMLAEISVLLHIHHTHHQNLYTCH